jgi:hypothetical protein
MEEPWSTLDVCANFNFGVAQLQIRPYAGPALRLHHGWTIYRLRRALRLPASDWVRLALLASLLCLSILCFFAIVQPFEAGIGSYRLGADSATYFAIARLLRDGGNIQFLAFSGSMLGPPLQALLLQTPFWVMVCNVALFFITIKLCARVPGLNRAKLALLLALNATTLVSLITLNKEIFALIATLLLCRYLYADKRSPWLLAILLAVGLMARWQQSAITLLFLFFWRKNSLFRQHPWLALHALIGLITIAYPIALRASPVGLAWATDQAQGGTIVVLDRIQASFGFPLVLIPKAMMSLFNHLITPGYWFTDYPQQDFHDLANQYVINLHTLAMLAVLLAVFVKGHLRLDRPIVFFSAIYIALVSSSPFMQPRYEYPVYVALCFELSRSERLRSPFFARISSRFPVLRSRPRVELVA